MRPSALIGRRREEALQRCWISSKRFERANSVLTRHLLAPLIDEVSVVERSRLDVSGFGGSANLIVIKRFSDQGLRAFVHLNRRGSDSAKHNFRFGDDCVATDRGSSPTVMEGSVTLVLDVSGHSQHRKIKRAPPPQLLIRRAPAIRW